MSEKKTENSYLRCPDCGEENVTKIRMMGGVACSCQTCEFSGLMELFVIKPDDKLKPARLPILDPREYYLRCPAEDCGHYIQTQFRATGNGYECRVCKYTDTCAAFTCEGVRPDLVNEVIYLKCPTCKQSSENNFAITEDGYRCKSCEYSGPCGEFTHPRIDMSGLQDVCHDIYEAGRPVDMVNHPPHYTSHPSGVECIEITRHMSFNLGNAIKYIWRSDIKDNPIENMKKAIFYIEDEIKRRQRGPDNG